VTGYLGRRLAGGILVLVAVFIATFVAVYFLPSDPARLLAGPGASASDVARIRASLGLDQPLLAQLGAYFGRLLTGNLGHSTSLDQDVLPALLQRLPATVELAVAGLALAIGIGVPLGVRSASKPKSRIDRGATVLAVIAVSTPTFWLGSMLRHYLAYEPNTLWGWSLFPIGGDGLFDPFSLALPALTLGLGGAAYYARITRTAMLDELRRPYIQTARAKGLSERDVLWRHGLANLMPAILAQVGLDLAAFLGGVAIVEAVFNWPGIGRVAVTAIVSADVSLILGTVVLATLFTVAANILVDLAIVARDPRLMARIVSA
jgi:peptide/nickel transport system permease protein